MELGILKWGDFLGLFRWFSVIMWMVSSREDFLVVIREREVITKEGLERYDVVNFEERELRVKEWGSLGVGKVGSGVFFRGCRGNLALRYFGFGLGRFIGIFDLFNCEVVNLCCLCYYIFGNLLS